MTSVGDSAHGEDEAAAQIRPRLIRRIYFAIIPVVLNVSAICGLNLATPTGSLGPRLALAATGVLLAVACYAVQGRPRIWADEETIRVRNLFTSRELPWSQVATLAYTGAAAWPHLQLANGETVALQAIQRWDNDHAVAAARTLRRLHTTHAQTPAAPNATAVVASSQVGQS